MRYNKKLNLKANSNWKSIKTDKIKRYHSTEQGAKYENPQEHNILDFRRLFFFSFQCTLY